MSETEPQIRTPRLRPFATVLATAALLGVAAAGWWGPSAALRQAVARGSEALGFRILSGGEAAVSLLDARIELSGFAAVRGDGDPVRLGRADIAFDWRALLGGRLELPTARLTGAALEIRRDRDGRFRIAGLPVGGGDGAEGDLPLPLRIGALELADVRLALRLPGGDREILVETLSLRGLALADPASRPRLEFVASLDGRQLRFDGTVAPFAAAPSIDGRVAAGRLALGGLARTFGVAFDGSLEGEADIAADATGRVRIDGAFALARTVHAGARADAVAWRGKATRTAAGDLEIDGRVDLQAPAFEQGGIAAGATSAGFDGRIALPAGKPPTASGTLTLAGSALVLPGGIGAASDSVRLELDGFALGADGALAGNAKIETQALAAEIAGIKLRAETARGQGRVAASGGPPSFDGTLELTTLAAEDGDGRVSAARVSFATLRYGPERVETVVFADAPAFAGADLALSAARVAFDGSVGLRDAALGTATGRLQATALKAELAAAGIRMTADEIGFDGNGAIAAAPAASGALSARGLAVAETGGRDLFAAADVAFEAFALEGAQLKARRAAFVDAKLLRQPGAGPTSYPWRVEAPRASLGDVRVDFGGGTAASVLRLERATLRATRTKDGLLGLDRADGAPEAPSPGLSLGRIDLVDARGVFEDRTPKTTVRVPFERVYGALGDLDDRRPERPTTLSLSARIGGFGDARARGTLFPFQPRLSFDLEFDARAIDLPPLSPYVEEALGSALRTGTATVEGRLVARDEALEGTTKWRLSNVRIDERAAAAGALEQSAGVPLATALALIADDAGDIALDIPVAGHLYDPTFDTGDAVRQAVGGALRGAISGTLSLLFPFGAIFSAVLDAERLGTGLILPAVEFAPGSASLAGAAPATVDGLAKLLAARPAARLEVCGYAGPADTPPDARAPDDGALRALAAARAEAVKRRLVGANSIDASRVFECRPTVEEAIVALPRAELRF